MENEIDPDLNGPAELFVSTDLDEIIGWYAMHLGILLSAERSSAFAASGVHLDNRRVGLIRVARSRVPADLTLIAASADAYALTAVRAGAIHVDEAKEQWTIGPTLAGLYRPPRVPRRNRISARTDMISLQIRRRDLERHLEDLIEEYIPGPIDFRPELSVHGQPAWLRLFRVFTDVFSDPYSVLHRPLVTKPLCEAMITALLYAADHPYRALLLQPIAAARPRHIRIVVDAIHTEPERPYTVGMLARIAGVSVRSLQHGFREHVGMPPLAYLRRVRLTRVHDQLQRGEGAGVTEAAHRWGFTHLGRFAAAYAAVYGVRPSITRSTIR
jgi:AraC-like DNA-binding protein